MLFTKEIITASTVAFAGLAAAASMLFAGTDYSKQPTNGETYVIGWSQEASPALVQDTAATTGSDLFVLNAGR